MKTYKKIITMIIVCFFTVPALAQVNNETEIDDATNQKMQTAFDTKYQGSDYSTVDWSLNDDGYYEGTFDYDNRELTTRFDKTGNWMNTSESITMNDLPARTQTSLSKNYKEQDILNINRIEDRTDRTYYEVTPQGSEPMKFDAAGNPIKNRK